MQNDWRSSPALNVISLIVSVIGLFLSSFTDISTLAKIVVIVAGAAGCLYAIFGGKALLTTSTSTMQKPADVTPAPPPAPSVNWESDQVSPTINYPQTPPNQPMPQPVRANPAVPPPAIGNGKGTSGWPFSLKDGLLMLLTFAIMFGLPGFLLFRSSVAWQHIVGIILLIFLGLGIMAMILPYASDDSVKTSYKLRELLGLVLGGGVVIGLPGFLLFRSSVAWQHIVGIILLIFLVLGVLGMVYNEFFENPVGDKSSNKSGETTNKPSR
jgi:hypothetical protein